MTIDELARAAGTTVRNVRVYQDRGLLPPPQRRGRLGVYGPEHLRRLRLVLRMLERGYPLAAIRELVEAWEEQRDIASVLGLEEAITAPYQDEGPRRVSSARFHELLGGDEVAAARAIETGLAQLDGDDVVVRNPRLFDLGGELMAEGFPPRAVMEVAAEIVRVMDEVAQMCVSFVGEHVWQGFVEAGMPAADTERVTGVIQRMRPRAQAAADAALAAAMEKYTDEVFTQTAQHLASKSRRRKPSAS
ncbi:MAG TPA: MerR family transcriptional regulator [Acidimicrobiia bacterium]|jgi:DNA-binding transcriptional MerR regulator|nr:MerR family transcriptional regulator [Acidimicrobiia bacterium]